MGVAPMTLEYEYQGPKRGVEQAVLLAHGAGADMHAKALTAVADALAAAKIASLRFNYPYRTAGKKAPDRPAVLMASTREAIAELAKRTKLPTDRLVIGGRSMGGRYCSLVAGDEDDPVAVAGLLLLGYPLHAAGKPEKERSDHFPRLKMPVAFVSGTRDSLAGRAALTKAAKKVKGKVTFHWLESADHGFRPLKSSGLTSDDVLSDVAAFSVDWVRARQE
jgi:predicted alpha/beta-hydrolase family hydrolase